MKSESGFSFAMASQPFESNKQTDSKIFTPKGHRNMKRKVKIYSITGVGISDDGLT